MDEIDIEKITNKTHSPQIPSYFSSTLVIARHRVIISIMKDQIKKNIETRIE